MMRAVSAGARALRNSDYVDPEVKRLLLSEILRCWEQTSRVLLVLLPILAEEGQATFDGAKFLVDGDFGDSLNKRIMGILVQIPNNVVRWSKDDLFSPKMGPLLLDHFNNESNELRRHELAILLIFQRPRGWATPIEKYIASVGKNSFYLLDIYQVLRGQYQYAYASRRTLGDIAHLIKMAGAKHVTGNKAPGPKLIKKVKFSEGVIPSREAASEG